MAEMFAIRATILPPIVRNQFALHFLWNDWINPVSKNEPHLARLAEYTEVIIRGETLEQFGAVCFRAGSNGQVEILLVTTRETRRWTIPKGWPIKGLKPHEIAEREAWEEAGVKGKAKKRPLGYYTYLKTLPDGSKAPALVQVHLLAVEKVSGKFPEYRERTIEWMSPIEAATRVDEQELKGLLTALMPDIQIPLGDCVSPRNLN